MKELERKHFFVHREQAGVDLFFHIEGNSWQILWLGTDSTGDSIRNKQLKFANWVENEVSIQEGMNSTCNSWVAWRMQIVFRCFSFTEIHIGCLSNFQVIYNKSWLTTNLFFCVTLQIHGWMKEAVWCYSEVYTEALSLLWFYERYEQFEALGLKIRCNLYELLWQLKNLRSQKIQNIFRERFLVQEIEASEMELIEMNSFSYFSNRKPSKKMKKLVGDFVMKPKKANSEGLNLKRERKNAH